MRAAASVDDQDDEGFPHPFGQYLLLQNFARSNPELQRAGTTRRVSMGGRQGLSTPLVNTSEATGQREYVNLATAQLRNGDILYVIGVAPQPEANTYERTFQRVRETLQIADR